LQQALDHTIRNPSALESGLELALALESWSVLGLELGMANCKIQVPSRGNLSSLFSGHLNMCHQDRPKYRRRG